MTKFCGYVGYAETTETSPGIWSEVIVEKKYYGDVTRQSRNLRFGDKINGELSLGVNISVVADAYANEHYFNIRYAVLDGARWVVSSVEPQRPRLLLTLGELYRGPIPEESN